MARTFTYIGHRIVVLDCAVVGQLLVRKLILEIIIFCAVERIQNTTLVKSTMHQVLWDARPCVCSLLAHSGWLEDCPVHKRKMVAM